MRIIPDADRTASGPNRAPERNEVEPSHGSPNTAASTPARSFTYGQPRVRARAGEARRLERVPRLVQRRPAGARCLVGWPWHVSIPHPRGIRENPRMGVRRQVAFRLAMSDRFESLVGAVPGARNGRTRGPGATSRARRWTRRSASRATCCAQGLGVSLDAFGELVRDPAEATEAATSYAALIDARSGAGRRRVGLGRPLAHRPRRLPRLLRHSAAAHHRAAAGRHAPAGRGRGRGALRRDPRHRRGGRRARRRAHLHAAGQPAAQHGRHRAGRRRSASPCGW